MFQQQFTDRALPHLGVALDVDLMRGVLAEQLFPTETLKARYQIAACEIIQARYKPGKNCLISYRLDINDQAVNQRHEQILCARVYESGGSVSRFAKAQVQPQTGAQFGAPIVHLPKLDMLAWVFPNDRKLVGLPKLADADCLKLEVLPPVISANFGSEWRIESLSNQIIHYVAEHTCTVKVTVELCSAATAETKTGVLFGKTYYNQEGAETFTRMRQLSESEACLSGRLTLALPLAYQPEIQTFWQMGLPGASLYEREADGEQFFALLEGAAQSLAALHQTPASCSRSIGVADLLARFDEVERMIVMLRPELLPKLRSLLVRLRSQAKRIGEQPTATLHGDLHLKNFFVTDEQVTLIDLDNLCTGDPLLELGSFIASLFYRQLAQQKPAERSLAMADIFIRAYSTAAFQPINRSILNWHIAAALIAERAYRCVTRLKSDRPSLLEEVIVLADTICARKQFISMPSFIHLF